MNWTVSLVTNHGPASAELCRRVKGHVHQAIDITVGNSRGTLTGTLTLYASNPVEAVRIATAMFTLALMRSGVTVVRIVSAHCYEEDQGSETYVPPLTTHMALAKEYGVSRSRINLLMREKGAPEPVPIEGSGSRILAYVMDEATAYLDQRFR